MNDNNLQRALDLEIEYTQHSSKGENNLILTIEEKLLYYMLILSIEYEIQLKMVRLGGLLAMHYNWKDLFKSELNSSINKIEKQYNKNDNLIIGRLSIDYLVDNPIPNTNLSTKFTFSNFFNSIYDDTSFFYFVFYHFPPMLLTNFNKKEIYIYNNNNNTNYSNLIQLILKKGVNTEKINERTLSNLTFYDIIIGSKVRNFKTISKIFGLYFYIFFLKNKILENKIDLIEIAKSYNGYDIDINKQNVINNTAFNSYKWDIQKFSDLNKLHRLFKDRFNNISLSDFKKVFSDKPIEDINPIITNFSNAELIYFIHYLMEKGFILLEKNLSIERLVSCFKNSQNKTLNKESIKSIKSKILSDNLEVQNQVINHLKKTKN